MPSRAESRCPRSDNRRPPPEPGVSGVRRFAHVLARHLLRRASGRIGSRPPAAGAGRPWRDSSPPTPATTMRGRARSIRAGRRVSGSAYGERLRRKRVPTGRRDRGATAPRRKEPPAPEAGAGTVGTGAQPPQAKAELLYAVLRRQGRPVGHGEAPAIPGGAGR